eukprot:TRINITY_DN359_c1_g2_i1.p1 TRINITY_DN359_c1_g2~~TRINITY_DN359_c1_g2_i1.p1  ORF type:complete len:269 (-),score=30.39 TRINITY_DN359_c1_g2_i1:145-951(-)
MDVVEFYQKYNIIKEISLSKFSEVVLVYNIEREEEEVLKVLKNGISKNETELASILTHKNILIPTQIDSLVLEDFSVYTVLTFKKCEMDLFDFIFSELYDFSSQQKYKLFIQMVNAVKYLHDNGMAHCDIKLENFLVDNTYSLNPHIYLIDFEHLLIQNKKKTSKYKAGTFQYLSPESFKRKKSIDAKAIDIYSLGICLHCLLTQYLPYSQTVDQKKGKRNIIKGKIVLDNDLNELELDLVKRMLSKKPKNRITINEILLHPLFENIC